MQTIMACIIRINIIGYNDDDNVDHNMVHTMWH